MRVTFRILRYDPERDANPHFESYPLELDDRAVVLDGLVQIKDFADSALTFRRSCRQAICGSCAMRVNDREHLTCSTQLSEVVRDGTVVVEPLANLPVIKDLAVDMEQFWRKYRAIMPFLIPDRAKPAPEKEYRMANKEARHLQQFGGCIQCGACYSSCPIAATDEEYLGPAALAKAYRFAGDPRDSARRERLKIVSDERGIWRCHTVFNCTEVCPKGVEPTYAIQQLKKLTIRRRFGLPV